MYAFEEAVRSSGPLSVSATISYVRSMNRAQADGLVEVARASPNAEVRELVDAL